MRGVVVALACSFSSMARLSPVLARGGAGVLARRSSHRRPTAAATIRQLATPRGCHTNLPGHNTKAGTYLPAVRAADQWTLAFAREAFKLPAVTKPLFLLKPGDEAHEG